MRRSFGRFSRRGACLYRQDVRVEAVGVVVLVGIMGIGVAAAAGDTHAIERRRGWPAALAARVVTDLWCGPVPASVRNTSAQPAVVVVGFTGGREPRDSAISGVVRLGRAVTEAAGHDPAVSVLLYNNAEWRDAVRDVAALRSSREGPPPRLVAYGHSLGAGAITKFARGLGRAGQSVDLAVYIDAFAWRNPRVPPNVRRAVNFYQRSGPLRGLPLRGKRILLPESPSSTAILGSYRLAPDTSRFGWHWNLVQPLFYRQHHRLAHDARIRQLLVSLAAPAVEQDDQCAVAAALKTTDLRRVGEP
jgi:hypothetical protein